MHCVADSREAFGKPKMGLIGSTMANMTAAPATGSGVAYP
jgi:hypothetical protein